MRTFLLLFVLFSSSLCVAEDPKVKYQSEQLLFRDFGRFLVRTRVSGTSAQLDEKWSSVCDLFLESFSKVDVQILGVVSDVRWADGVATVSYLSKISEKVSSAVGVRACYRRVQLSMSEDVARSINRGDKVDLSCRLLFVRDGERVVLEIPHMVYRVSFTRVVGGKFLRLSGVFAARQIDGSIGSFKVEFRVSK